MVTVEEGEAEDHDNFVDGHGDEDYILKGGWTMREDWTMRLTENADGAIMLA